MYIHLSVQACINLWTCPRIHHVCSDTVFSLCSSIRAKRTFVSLDKKRCESYRSIAVDQTRCYEAIQFELVQIVCDKLVQYRFPLNNGRLWKNLWRYTTAILYLELCLWIHWAKHKQGHIHCFIWAGSGDHILGTYGYNSVNFVKCIKFSFYAYLICAFLESDSFATAAATSLPSNMFVMHGFNAGVL